MAEIRGEWLGQEAWARLGPKAYSRRGGQKVVESARMWDPTLRAPYQPKGQIDGVERFLTLEPRSRILDLACGAGRQTLELARRGHRVLGMDSAIAEAKAAAKHERLNVHFMKCDIRQIPYKAEFDAVVSLFTGFGTLPNERDDLRCLESIKRALKPEGKLLLDLLNKEWLMRHFEPNFWEQDENKKGDVVLDQISFNFETGRLDNHRTIVGPDGKRQPSFVSLRVYTLTELKGLLERAGLVYVQSWGGFDGGAYGMDSPRMIVLARRPPERARRKVEDNLPKALRIKGRR